MKLSLVRVLGIVVMGFGVLPACAADSCHADGG